MKLYSIAGFLTLTAVILGSAGLMAEQPTITVRIQCIRVCDDDGGRPALVTPGQFKQWVDVANRLYDAAGIRFMFSEADFSSLRNTMLNNIVMQQHWDSEPEKLASRVADKYPDRIVVYCRYGPGETATGHSYSFWNQRYVAMSGFPQTGRPDLTALAHELGHYLGLHHTFRGYAFPDIGTAEKALRSAVDKQSVFDGDGLRDTPPDPLIIGNESDRSVSSVAVGGTTYVLPRLNLMSYYEERESLTSQQIARARWFLQMRLRSGMGRPTNLDVRSPIEAEEMRVIGKYDCHTSSERTPQRGGWSGGRQLACNLGQAGTITLALRVKRDGRFFMNLYATQAPNYGKIQVFLDGKRLGPPYDAFGYYTLPSGRIPVGELKLTKGEHRLRFDAVGKNEASGGFSFGVDCVELVP